MVSEFRWLLGSLAPWLLGFLAPYLCDATTFAGTLSEVPASLLPPCCSPCCLPGHTACVTLALTLKKVFFLLWRRRFFHSDESREEVSRLHSTAKLWQVSRRGESFACSRSAISHAKISNECELRCLELKVCTVCSELHLRARLDVRPWLQRTPCRH